MAIFLSIWEYGSMKTTVELPEELLVEAKKVAAERRTTLRALIARGLRLALTEPTAGNTATIEWIVSDGGLPPGLDVADGRRLRAWAHDAE